MNNYETDVQNLVSSQKSCIIDLNSVSKRVDISLRKLRFLRNHLNKKNFLFVHDGSDTDGVKKHLTGSTIMTKSALEIKHRFNLKEYNKNDYDYILKSVKLYNKRVNDLIVSKTPHNLLDLFVKVVNYITPKKIVSDLKIILHKLEVERNIKEISLEQRDKSDLLSIKRQIIKIQSYIDKLEIANAIDSEILQKLKDNINTNNNKYYSALFYLLVEKQQMTRSINYSIENKDDQNRSMSVMKYRTSKEYKYDKECYIELIKEVFAQKDNVYDFFANDKNEIKELIYKNITMKNSKEKKFDAIIVENAQNIDPYIISSLEFYSNILILTGNTLQSGSKIGKWQDLYNYDLFKNKNGTVNIAIEDSDIYKKVINNIKVPKQARSENNPKIAIGSSTNRELKKVISKLQLKHIENIVCISKGAKLEQYRKDFAKEDVEFKSLNEIRNIGSEYTFIADISNFSENDIYSLLNYKKENLILICGKIEKYEESKLRDLKDINLLEAIYL